MDIIQIINVVMRPINILDISIFLYISIKLNAEFNPLENIITDAKDKRIVSSTQ